MHKVDLHSNQLSSSGLDAIASPLLESKGELDVLDLSDNKIRSIDPDSSLLRLLKGCSRLTRLNLQHSLTTAREDDKVALFDCLASNRSIKWLDLSCRCAGSRTRRCNIDGARLGGARLGGGGRCPPPPEAASLAPAAATRLCPARWPPSSTRL